MLNLCTCHQEKTEDHDTGVAKVKEDGGGVLNVQLGSKHRHECLTLQLKLKRRGGTLCVLSM